MAKKKKLIVAVIVISLFAVMSLCGMAVAGQQAMDRSDFHGSEDNVIDILDGVMYPGEKYLVEDGEYRHKIDKSGEYFVYVINASSDPLSLKSGDICN